MKIIKIVFSVALVSLMATSCKKLKDFGDTNVNPNGTETPSTAALLTNVESALIGANTQGGLYSQMFAETQYTDVSLYALPKLNFDGIYAGNLMDLQNIINTNTNDATKGAAAKFGANANQIALARILKAYIFWTITDRWGDVPYSGALKGDSNLTPKYDKQEDIYKDLVKELAQAKAQIDGNLAAPTGDIIYFKPSATKSGGGAWGQSDWPAAAAKWKKFANSLRMLIALRTSKVYPNNGEWAATSFAAAYNDADGYIATNADNFVINYPGNVTAFKNPWFNLYDGRSDYAESKVMTDLMASLADPRQAAFGSSTVGFPYGLKRDDAVAFGNNNSNYAKVLADSRRAANSPLVIVGAAHVLLAIAEAAQRGWITGVNIATTYQAAIQASWDQWGVSANGNITTYLANASVALTGAASDLQKIQLQQYIAWYPDGTQAWANWRRTGVPALTPTPNAVNAGGKIPRRYTYGNNEYSVNVANVTEAASRIGGDTPDTKVWWDK